MLSLKSLLFNLIEFPGIDEFQEYSYKYNVKIVGVPQMSQDKSSAITSALCERLFKAMGSAVSIQDIDTAH